MERIERNGIIYAVILNKKDANVKKNTFFTENNAPLQMGILAHGADYLEKPHYHRTHELGKTNVWQYVKIIKGTMEISFYDQKWKKFKTIKLKKDESILLMDGIHSAKSERGFLAETIKQGPYVSVAEDKVEKG